MYDQVVKCQRAGLCLSVHFLIIKSDSQNFYLFFQCSSGVRDIDLCDVHITVSSLPGAKKNAVSFVRIKGQTVWTTPVVKVAETRF